MKSERHSWQGETWVCVCAQVCVCVFCPSVHVQQNEGWLKDERVSFSLIPLSSLARPPEFYGLQVALACHYCNGHANQEPGFQNHETTDKEKVQEEKKREAVNQSHLPPLRERGAVPEASPNAGRHNTAGDGRNVGSFIINSESAAPRIPTRAFSPSPFDPARRAFVSTDRERETRARNVRNEASSLIKFQSVN